MLGCSLSEISLCIMLAIIVLGPECAPLVIQGIQQSRKLKTALYTQWQQALSDKGLE